MVIAGRDSVHSILPLNARTEGEPLAFEIDKITESIENADHTGHGVSSRLTKEDEEEISRELAEYRAAHPKTPATEMVLA